MIEVFATFLRGQHSRPYSVGVSIAALFLPATLLLYVARPVLFWQLALPKLLLLAAGMTLPVLILATSIWETIVRALIAQERHIAEKGYMPPSFQASLSADDDAEWPALRAGGWMTAVCMFCATAAAYLRPPVRVGATVLLICGILAGLWVVLNVLIAIVGALTLRGSSNVPAPTPRRLPVADRVVPLWGVGASLHAWCAVGNAEFSGFYRVSIADGGPRLVRGLHA